MKLASFALLTAFAVAGYVQGQTIPPETPPAPSESTPQKSHQHPLSSSCRDEVAKVCGPAHGKEMMGCVKDNLDSNKFSAGCQSELREHVKQPAKPAS